MGTLNAATAQKIGPVNPQPGNYSMKYLAYNNIAVIISLNMCMLHSKTGMNK